jgi:hypothetical protein
MNVARWRHFFRPDEEAREQRAEKLRDAVTCIQTSTWAYFKDRVRKKARAHSYNKPGMTNEQAASSLIAQTVYNEVLEEIEHVERATAQKVTNG